MPAVVGLCLYMQDRRLIGQLDMKRHIAAMHPHRGLLCADTLPDFYLRGLQR